MHLAIAIASLAICVAVNIANYRLYRQARKALTAARESAVAAQESLATAQRALAAAQARICTRHGGWCPACNRTHSHQEDANWYLQDALWRQAAKR